MTRRNRKTDRATPFDPVAGAKIVAGMERGLGFGEACDAAGVVRRIGSAWEARGARASMSPEGAWRREMQAIQSKAAFRAEARPLAPHLGPEVAEIRTPDDSVRRIARMIAQGHWYGTRSLVALADELGVSIDKVRKLSAEAARLVRFSVEDADELATMTTAHMARLERMGEQAEQRGQLKDAISAIRVQGELAGTIRQGSAPNIQILNQQVMESPEFAAWLGRDVVPHLCPGCVRRLYESFDKTPGKDD